MRKSLKYCLVAVIGLFLCGTTAKAHQLNMQELGAEIDKIDEYANYAYIVGEYVFVGDITLEDVMVASSTIDFGSEKLTLKEKYDKLHIYKIKNVNGKWVSGNSLIGSERLDDVMDDANKKREFTFINGTYVVADTKYTISNNFAISSEFQTAIQGIKLPDYHRINGSLEVSGIMPKNSLRKVGNVETEYYYPYVLHIDGANASTKVEFEDGKSKIIAQDGENYLILASLVRKNYADNQVTTAIIDRDGDGESYREEKYTLTFIGDFQENSEAKLSLNQSSISEYEKNENENVTLAQQGNSVTLEKKLYKQYNVDAFKESKDGYYFAIDLKTKNNESLENSTVKAMINGSDKNVKIIKNNEKATIVARFTEDDFKTCESNAKNCELVITYDWDGKLQNSNQYLPTEYVIDFSKITLKDVSTPTSIDLSTDLLSSKRNADGTEVINGFLNKNSKISYQLVTKENPVAGANGVVKVKHAGSVQSYDANAFSGNSLTIEYNVPTDGDQSFTIIVDLDGDGEKFDSYELKVDYTYLYIGDENSKEYYAYLLNEAITKTNEAKNLTVTKDNNIYGKQEKFTEQIDRENGLKYATVDSTNKYIVNLKNIYGNDSKVSLVVRKGENLENRPEINGWIYENILEVSMGVNELSLLRNIVYKNASKIVNIDKDANTYTIKMKSSDLVDLLNDQYSLKLAETEISSNQEEISLNVTLENSYISSIKVDGLKIKESTNNRINVTIFDVGNTHIDSPENVLGNIDAIKEFYDRIKE